MNDVAKFTDIISQRSHFIFLFRLYPKTHALGFHIESILRHKRQTEYSTCLGRFKRNLTLILLRDKFHFHFEVDFGFGSFFSNRQTEEFQPQKAAKYLVANGARFCPPLNPLTQTSSAMDLPLSAVPISHLPTFKIDEDFSRGD